MHVYMYMYVYKDSLCVDVCGSAHCCGCVVNGSNAKVVLLLSGAHERRRRAKERVTEDHQNPD